jgi:hypothetical protein
MMARGKLLFKERDLARALRGVAKSGIPTQEMRIAPDGTIRIILGSPVFGSQQQDRSHEGANEWDDVA